MIGIKTEKKNIYEIVIITLFFCYSVFFVGYILHTHHAIGSAADNVSGYAWSNTIGWISFNCTDSGTCGAVDHGVSVDAGTGDFSGYAWGENVGWIDLDPGALYPETPNHGARLESDDTVSGWAKALSADGLGWDGWIKLSDTSAPAYGVTLNTVTNEFEGFAWGSDIVGWISFNCIDTASCGVSNYAVVYSPPNILPTSGIDKPESKDYPEGMDIDFLGWGNDTDGSVVAAEWRDYGASAVGDCDAGVLLPSTFVTPNSYFTKNDLAIGNHKICFRVQDDDADWSEVKIEHVRVVKIVAKTECSDDINNDTDTWFDDGLIGAGEDLTQADPACYDVSSSTNPIYHWEYVDESSDPQCSDGIDNDSDGLTDSDDPGCHIDNDPAKAYNKFNDSEDTCGNSICDIGETYLSCSQDCSYSWIEF